jgi:hypothetical protein
MSSNQPDVISSQPHTLSNRSAWAAVVLLAAAFVAAFVVAVHYHNQVASLQHHLSRVQGRPPSAATAPVASSSSGLPVADTRVILLGSNSLIAQVTVVAASSPARQVHIAVTAHISGGRPHTRYMLVWQPETCSRTSPQQMAAGVTDANGRADLVGQIWRASVTGSYQLQLVPGISGLQSLAIYGYWSQPTLRGYGQTVSGC